MRQDDADTFEHISAHSSGNRFHPSVKWQKGYPDRQQIVSQITQIWKAYRLEQRTRFNTKITRVYKDADGYWIINDPSNGRYDGIIAAVGTCGDPKMPHIPEQDKFQGSVYHSSQLDGKQAKGKRVLVIGGGASAVEALEFVAAEDAADTAVLARVSPLVVLHRLLHCYAPRVRGCMIAHQLAVGKVDHSTQPHRRYPPLAQCFRHGDPPLLGS